MILREIDKELKKAADPERAKTSLRFFKTGKGQYGEGDKFLGLTMPEQRKIAKKYFDKISVADTLKLLKNKFHEARMVALLILVFKYEKGIEVEKKQIFKTYLANTKFINNWDLVDVTCPKIVGAYLFTSIHQSKNKNAKNIKILYRLAKSKSLWEKRIAMIATLYFISKGKLDDTFKIASILLADKHDLIHKAIGWMLRESGKKDKPKLISFLNTHLNKLPRTTLRYAIERFPEKERVRILKTPSF